MIKKNMIRCRLCGDFLESKHRHDFVACSCMKKDESKGCAVDGGKDYLRRCGDNWEDLSEVED